MTNIWNLYKALTIAFVAGIFVILTGCTNSGAPEWDESSITGGWVEIDSTGNRMPFGVALYQNGSLFVENANQGSAIKWELDHKKLTLHMDDDGTGYQVNFKIEALTDSTLKVTHLNTDQIRYFRKRRYGENADAIIQRIREIIEQTNQQSDELKTLIAEIPTFPAGEPRRLTAFHDKELKKLVVTEPDDYGLMSGRSEFYTLEDQLIFIRMPYTGYVFENDRLVLRVDQSMNPVQASSEQISKREHELLTDYSRYKNILGFGNNQPL